MHSGTSAGFYPRYSSTPSSLFLDNFAELLIDFFDLVKIVHSFRNSSLLIVSVIRELFQFFFSFLISKLVLVFMCATFDERHFYFEPFVAFADTFFSLQNFLKKKKKKLTRQSWGQKGRSPLPLLRRSKINLHAFFQDFLIFLSIVRLTALKSSRIS